MTPAPTVVDATTERATGWLHVREREQSEDVRITTNRGGDYVLHVRRGLLSGAALAAVNDTLGRFEVTLVVGGVE